jgi:hypothetical protein
MVLLRLLHHMVPSINLGYEACSACMRCADEISLLDLHLENIVSILHAGRLSEPTISIEVLLYLAIYTIKPGIWKNQDW